MKHIKFGDLEYNIPQGRLEIEQTYLQPMFSYCQEAVVILPKPINNVSEFRCHRKAKSIIQKFFDELEQRGLLPALLTFNGCYDEKTTKAYPPKPSVQQWGIAFRLNMPYNEFCSNPPTVEPENDQFPAPGPKFWSGHPVVELAQEMGFEWGGTKHISEPDLFQLCSDY